LIVPILKPGKGPDFATSYRPIALTTCVFKIMKKLVNNHFTDLLEEKGYLPMEQYGFRKNGPTEDVHTIRESEIQEAFREKQHFLLVSLDLTKAYDACWRYNVIRILRDWQIKGHLLHFLKNFMADRKFRVMQAGQIISGSR
jgi:hypothetical protein